MVARIGPPHCSLGRLGRSASPISQWCVRFVVILESSLSTVASVGSAAKGEGESADEHEHLEALKTALLRLPKVHLYVLDAIVLHLRALVLRFSIFYASLIICLRLIDNTEVEETDEVYVTKLALSIGRSELLLSLIYVRLRVALAILRPKFETSVSVQDRHPAIFFVDLVNHYVDVLPPTIAKKKADTERKAPLRKRTAPVDMRMSRSRLSAGTEARDWLANQRAQGNIPPPVPPPAPTVPPVSKVSEPAPTPTPPVAQPLQVPPPPPLPEVKPTPAPGPPKLAAPVPVPAAPAVKPDVPTRPVFKSPPPEDDELPPRPAFSSPPPESDRESPAPVPAAAPAKPQIPTPKRRNSGSPRPNPGRTGTPRMRSPSNSSSPLAASARSSSPAISQSEDTQPNINRTSLSRGPSSETGRVRRPGGSRAPRGGNVSSMISNLNRTSQASDPRTSPPPSAGLQRGGRGRPQSGVVEERRRSLTGLARRTMDSDAEEGVVG
jgi:hypothetical protein